MEKKISFKTWITVFFGGIWQFICHIFSWGNKTPFWRIIWATIAVCFLTVTVIIGYAFYDEFYGRRHRRDAYYAKQHLGDKYYFYNNGRGAGKSYIAERLTGQKILTGLDWIARSEDGDSLVVFAKDGKRGFFNRFSGVVAIPAKYDAAWCFSDGVAGVCEGDSVFFIDHLGIPINSIKFKRVPDRSYVYHGDFFVFSDGSKYGLIDRDGKVAMAAIYDEITPVANNMWNVRFNDSYGTLNAAGKLIVPCEYKKIYVYPHGGIVTVLQDNSKKRIDYDGNVTDNFVYDYTNTLEYVSDDSNKDGERIRKPANLSLYSSEGHYGLIDRDGRPITPPVYSSISAYSYDLYECQIDDGGELLIVDEKGQKVN